MKCSAVNIIVYTTDIQHFVLKARVFEAMCMSSVLGIGLSEIKNCKIKICSVVVSAKTDSILNGTFCSWHHLKQEQLKSSPFASETF